MFHVNGDTTGFCPQTQKLFQKMPLNSTFLSHCGTVYYSVQGDFLSLRMKSYGVTIQMKATEQYFPVVLFIMLYKVVLTFESEDEILQCDHSNERY